MRIVLIGFMGSGKSVVGECLASELNMKFIDLDIEIENREQKTISNIFKECGEEYFRELESNILSELLKENSIVISTGGGIIKREKNIELLKLERKVVFLDASVKTIQRNVLKEINKRPLLKNSKNLYETIDNLLKERYDKYNSIYDIKISVNDKNISEVVSEILVYIR